MHSSFLRLCSKAWWIMSFWDLLQQLHQDVPWLKFMASTRRSIISDSTSIHVLPAVMSTDARSSYTAGRDVFNGYLGNAGYTFVATGNLLCSRLALALLLCWAKGIRFLVEQPEGSSMPHHPRFQQVLGIGRAPWLKVYVIRRVSNVHLYIYIALYCIQFM